MAAVTLTTLRARVREAADLVGSSFIADTATGLDALINSALDELYELVIKGFGDDYTTSSAFVTVANVTTVALPADFFQLVGVELTYNGQIRTLKKYEFQERNAYRLTTRQGDIPRYRREGNNLRLYPAPVAAIAGTIWYIQTRTPLVAGGDSCNFPNGWEQYAVLKAAMLAKSKGEDDLTSIAALFGDIKQRIELAISDRDQAEPAQIVDTDLAYRFEDFGDIG